MKRVIPWILTFAALAAYPREHSYRAGTLDEIAIQDMTTTISIPVMTGPGGSLPYLLHMGLTINSRFGLTIFSMSRIVGRRIRRTTALHGS